MDQITITRKEFHDRAEKRVLEIPLTDEVIKEFMIPAKRDFGWWLVREIILGFIEEEIFGEETEEGSNGNI